MAKRKYPRVMVNGTVEIAKSADKQFKLVNFHDASREGLSIVLRTEQHEFNVDDEITIRFIIDSEFEKLGQIKQIVKESGQVKVGIFLGNCGGVDFLSFILEHHIATAVFTAPDDAYTGSVEEVETIIDHGIHETMVKRFPFRFEDNLKKSLAPCKPEDILKSSKEKISSIFLYTDRVIVNIRTFFSIDDVRHLLKMDTSSFEPGDFQRVCVALMNEYCNLVGGVIKIWLTANIKNSDVVNNNLVVLPNCYDFKEPRIISISAKDSIRIQGCYSVKTSPTTEILFSYTVDFAKSKSIIDLVREINKTNPIEEVLNPKKDDEEDAEFL